MSLGDHSETIQIEYDPEQVSYRELLAVFWNSHNPIYESYSRQYRSVIFNHNDQQKRLASETKAAEQLKRGSDVFTEITPIDEFYLAEGYHQKYYLRKIPEIKNELVAIYPEIEDLVASTAAARINGYLGGYGSLDVLKEEVDTYGLSSQARAHLLEIVPPRLESASCSLR